MKIAIWASDVALLVKGHRPEGLAARGESLRVAETGGARPSAASPLA
jgi:hypothetical protein